MFVWKPHPPHCPNTEKEESTLTTISLHRNMYLNQHSENVCVKTNSKGVVRWWKSSYWVLTLLNGRNPCQVSCMLNSRKLQDAPNPQHIRTNTWVWITGRKFQRKYIKGLSSGVFVHKLHNGAMLIFKVLSASYTIGVYRADTICGQALQSYIYACVFVYMCR